MKIVLGFGLTVGSSNGGGGRGGGAAGGDRRSAAAEEDGREGRPAHRWPHPTYRSGGGGGRAAAEPRPGQCVVRTPLRPSASAATVAFWASSGLWMRPR